MILLCLMIRWYKNGLLGSCFSFYDTHYSNYQQLILQVLVRICIDLTNNLQVHFWTMDIEPELRSVITSLNRVTFSDLSGPELKINFKYHDFKLKDSKCHNLK